MQKVYLLLRNNQRTGPFTLDEILQLNLKPFDLVWVEGKSAAWRYPGEIDSLKSFVPEPPQPASPFQPIETSVLDGTVSTATHAEIPAPIALPRRKVFVSMPEKSMSQPIQQKPSVSVQKELTREALPADKETSLYMPIANENAAKEESQTRYTRSLEQVEDAYTNWVVNQKQKPGKRISTRDMGIVMLVLAIILGGYWVMNRPALIQPAQEIQKTAALPPSAPVENIQESDAEKEVEEDQPAQHKKLNKNESIKANSPGKQEIKTVGTKTKTASSKEPETKEQTVYNETQTDIPRELPDTKAEPDKKEKKKLGQVIRGIFSKKDKKKENEAEDTEAPHSVPDRKSAKRGETPAPVQADLSEITSMIDLQADASDEWMMGMIGLKVTLRNRSNSILQTAIVVVSYYDNHDKLLQKKTVHFSKVPSRGKMTVSAPDHRFAQRVELHLEGITVNEDRYAGNQ